MLTDAYGLDWLADVKRCWSSDEHAIVVDVGANVGRFTCSVATAFPRNHVHAFEPVRSTRGTLRANVADLSNVTIHAGALGDTRAPLWMTATPDSEINRVVPMDEAGNVAVEEVTGDTLDGFLAGLGHPRVGLLKIDAEGYDLKVIEGASGCLARGAVDLAIVECTFNPRGAPHVDVLDLVPRMRQLDFEVVAVYSQNVGRFCRGSGYSDILFAHR
jgi:FkbM family methyltransferase